MNILFANGRLAYPFIIGGDAVNIHTYFSYMEKRGHTCTWLASTSGHPQARPLHKLERINVLFRAGLAPSVRIKFHRLRPFLSITYRPSYRCIEVGEDHFVHTLKTMIRTNRPDVVLTQLDRSDDVIQVANACGVPSVLLLPDSEYVSLSRLLQSRPQPTRVVCVSEFVRSRALSVSHGPLAVFYPPIEPSAYQTRTNRTGRYITCINPIAPKGGAILAEIIRRCPQEQFLLVEGWYPPEVDGFAFTRFPNVTMMPKQQIMKHVYEKTKLLLVPSVWDEAIPRVIFEAGINGIPSIASRRGGIEEALGPKGVLIKNPYDIGAWVHAIRTFAHNPTLLQRTGEAQRRHTRRFTIYAIGPRFERFLKNTVKDHTKHSQDQKTRYNTTHA